MLCIGCDVWPIHLYVAYGCLIVDVTPKHKETCVIDWSRSTFHPTYVNISRLDSICFMIFHLFSLPKPIKGFALFTVS